MHSPPLRLFTAWTHTVILAEPYTREMMEGGRYLIHMDDALRSDGTPLFYEVVTQIEHSPTATFLQYDGIVFEYLAEEGNPLPDSIWSEEEMCSVILLAERYIEDAANFQEENQEDNPDGPSLVDIE